jgi:hypothetical protein
MPAGKIRPNSNLALASLEAALGLVDHVNAALAADQAVVAVTGTQRLQRVTDFHRSILSTCDRDFKSRALQAAKSAKMGFNPLAAEPPGTRGF